MQIFLRRRRSTLQNFLACCNEGTPQSEFLRTIARRPVSEVPGVCGGIVTVKAFSGLSKANSVALLCWVGYTEFAALQERGADRCVLR